MEDSTAGKAQLEEQWRTPASAITQFHRQVSAIDFSQTNFD
jgi:hypothetical protein